MKAPGNRRSNRQANKASSRVPQPAERRRRRRIWMLRAALAIGSLVVAMLLAETGIRLFFRGKFPIVEDERSLLYRYHPTLGWIPAANTTRLFTGSRTVTVTHNSQGFRS